MGLGSIVKSVTKVAKSAAPSIAKFAGSYFGSPEIGNMIGEGLNSALSAYGQEQANAFNAKEAEKNRQWQEQMRATQYQTAVKDMEAAGLNPMLAYQQGGAGNLSGAVSAAAQNALGSGISSALETRQLNNQIKSTEQQIEESKDRSYLYGQQALTEAARGRDITQSTILNARRDQRDAQLNEATLRLLASQEQANKVNSAATLVNMKNNQADYNQKKVDSDYYGSSTGKFFRNVGNSARELASIFSFLK